MVVEIVLFVCLIVVGIFFTEHFPYRCSLSIVHILYNMMKNKGVFYVNCLQFAIVSGLMFLTDFFAMF